MQARFTSLSQEVIEPTAYDQGRRVPLSLRFVN